MFIWPLTQVALASGVFAADLLTTTRALAATRWRCSAIHHTLIRDPAGGSFNIRSLWKGLTGPIDVGGNSTMQVCLVPCADQKNIVQTCEVIGPTREVEFVQSMSAALHFLDELALLRMNFATCRLDNGIVSGGVRLTLE